MKSFQIDIEDSWKESVRVGNVTEMVICIKGVYRRKPNRALAAKPDSLELGRKSN